MYMSRKGVTFSYRDTFNMDAVLNPIIHDAIVKFRDTLIERNNKGLIVGVPILKSCSDSDVQSMDYGEADFDGWIDILNKMIYSFGNNEPNIEKYHVGLYDERIEVEGQSTKRFTIKAKDEVAYERYKEDCKIHEEKVKEGLQLFAIYLNSLWW